MKNIFFISTLISYSASSFGAADSKKPTIQLADEHHIIGTACKSGFYAIKRGAVDSKYVCTVAHTMKTHLDRNQLQSLANTLFMQATTTKLKGRELVNAVLAPDVRTFSLDSETETQLTLGSFIFDNETQTTAVTTAIIEALYLKEGKPGISRRSEDFSSMTLKPDTRHIAFSFDCSTNDTMPIPIDVTDSTDPNVQAETILRTRMINGQLITESADLIVVIDRTTRTDEDESSCRIL